MSRLLLAAFILGIIMHHASAQDPTGKYLTSPYALWFSEQYSMGGQWCCNGADGHYYDGDYNLDPDGGVTLKLATGDIVIPPDKIVRPTNPQNPTGHAVWWYYGDSASEDGTYCFAPGPLT